jgi:hypothetical protein
MESWYLKKLEKGVQVVLSDFIYTNKEIFLILLNYIILHTNISILVNSVFSLVSWLTERIDRLSWKIPCPGYYALLAGCMILFAKIASCMLLFVRIAQIAS